MSALNESQILDQALRDVSIAVAEASERVRLTVGRAMWEINGEQPAQAADSMLIVELGLSVRSLNCLKRAGVRTVGELAAMTEADLAAIPNFGVKCQQEIAEALDEWKVRSGGVTARECAEALLSLWGIAGGECPHGHGFESDCEAAVCVMCSGVGCAECGGSGMEVCAFNVVRPMLRRARAAVT